ncbi:MAG TPA: threonylcarbamoyl-AMP synthase [Firmicutes bacterium]|jgi:L-threonylcarbamoyladenylate synthase|nr:threonylcarbamoyl-AMP synthase [Bacillota bacterium]HOQ23914.1 L-threonylcarbamoyladenylate synthase [Bacillota bacterium]
METVIYRLPDPREDTWLEHAAETLQRGGLVAFPTETVYGLGAAMSHPPAIRQVFTVKVRPNDNPLILHIYELGQLAEIAREIPPVAYRLAERFWPGPLTLVLPARPEVPAEVTAGLPTVAVRMPSHPVALALLRKTGIPVAAPSANLSGRPSPTTGDAVVEDLFGAIDVIIDAGPTGVGLESTVLDLTGDRPRVLRPGGVTPEMLAEVFGPGIVEAPWRVEAQRPAAPGMKYRHYAPKAPMKVFAGPVEKVREAINGCLRMDLPQGKKVAVLGFEDSRDRYPGAIFKSLGEREHPEAAAHRLFMLLRTCDREHVDQIYGELPTTQGVGLAVVNRLWKAAGGDLIEL